MWLIQHVLRFLVLRRWAPQLKKLNTCRDLLAKAEQSTLLLRETADRLYFHRQMVDSTTRESLHPITTAVAVLGSGSPRNIPKCVQNLAALKPPTIPEVRSSIGWLDKQIALRLIDTKLPSDLNKTVENGRLWLEAQHLFKLSVTLTSSDSCAPWRLLSVDILVLDGTSDEQLVSRDQVPNLFGVLNERLRYSTVKDPLFYTLSCLKYFCISLQITVMSDEAKRLQNGSWAGYIQVKIEPGQSIEVQYWKDACLRLELIRGFAGPEDDQEDSSQLVSLRVTHSPMLSDPETGKPVDLALKRNCLTHLISEVGGLYAGARLRDCIKKLADEGLYPNDGHHIAVRLITSSSVAPAILVELAGASSVCSVVKQKVVVWIRVIAHTGAFQFVVANGSDGLQLKDEILSRLGAALDADTSSIVAAVRELAKLAILHSLREAARREGLAPVSQPTLLGVDKLESDVLYLKFRDYPLFYLVVRVKDKLKEAFHLVQIAPATASKQVMRDIALADEESSTASMGFKAAVAQCFRKIPKVIFSQQLVSAGLPYTPIDSEDDIATILKLPVSPDAPRLSDLFTLCTISAKADEWCVCVFVEDEFRESLGRHVVPVGSVRGVVKYVPNECKITYLYRDPNSLIATFLGDWIKTCRLYEIASDLEGSVVTVNGFTCKFEFTRLSIKYQTAPTPGAKKPVQQSAFIEWSPSTSSYSLSFGSAVLKSNPHTILVNELATEYLGQSVKPVDLLLVLQRTLSPLSSFQQCPGFTREFSFLPRTSIMGRLIFFRNTCGVDLTFETDDYVTIRDAAYRRFDATADADYLIIPGLAEFFESCGNGLSLTADGGVKVTSTAFGEAFRAGPGDSRCRFARFLLSVLLRKHVFDIISTAAGLVMEAGGPSSSILKWRDTRGRICELQSNTDYDSKLVVQLPPTDEAEAALGDQFSRFLMERIAVHPVGCRSAVESFIAVLHAPTVLMRAVAEIIALDLDSVCPRSGGLRLLLTIPPGLREEHCGALCAGDPAIQVDA